MQVYYSAPPPDHNFNRRHFGQNMTTFLYVVANATPLDIFSNIGIDTIWLLMRRRLIHTIFRLGFACSFVG
jgi:hypothetical protein